MANDYYPFINAPLMCPFTAFEPYIDAKTMMLHHDNHLQAYIDNLNAILADNERLQTMSLEELIINADSLPSDIRDAVRNNAGGVWNHRFFFGNLVNAGLSPPRGQFGDAIAETFGSFEQFQQDFKEAALSVFGSGYAWLVLDDGKLRIVTTANQNTPLENGMCPILGLDVWEHAYYLKHYNDRASYIDDWFNVASWNVANINYQKCLEQET